MSLNFNPEVKIASFQRAQKNAIQKEFPINTRLEVDGFIYHTSYTKKKCKCIRPTTCIQRLSSVSMIWYLGVEKLLKPLEKISEALGKYTL